MISVPFHATPEPLLLEYLKHRSDIVVLFRAGVRLEPSLIDEVAALFAGDRAPAACLYRAKLANFGDQHLEIRSAGRTGTPQTSLRYLAPAALFIASHCFNAARFERFVERSTWATFRICLDRLGEDGYSVVERETAFLHGADGPGVPCRIAGRRLSAELRRFCQVHPRHSNFAAMERLRALAQHVAAATIGDHPRARLDFVAGVLSEMSDAARLRRRLNRDIAEMA